MISVGKKGNHHASFTDFFFRFIKGILLLFCHVVHKIFIHYFRKTQVGSAF